MVLGDEDTWDPEIHGSPGSDQGDSRESAADQQPATPQQNPEDSFSFLTDSPQEENRNHNQQNPHEQQTPDQPRGTNQQQERSPAHSQDRRRQWPLAPASGTPGSGTVGDSVRGFVAGPGWQGPPGPANNDSPGRSQQPGHQQPGPRQGTRLGAGGNRPLGQAAGGGRMPGYSQQGVAQSGNAAPQRAQRPAVNESQMPGSNQAQRPAGRQPQSGAQTGEENTYGHYRDCGILPWWAWSAIGATVIACGALVFIAASPSSLDPTSSQGFDPAFHDKYEGMAVLGPGAEFSETVDDVPWEVSIAEVNWHATEQVASETSMSSPANGMRYVGVRIDAGTNYLNSTPVEEAFLFYYITPAGQEYTEHFCGWGCLESASTSATEFDGWVYFEVPAEIPEGGYLRVNLLYSGENDTLMEMQ